MEISAPPNMISHFSQPQIGPSDPKLGHSRTFVSGAFVSAKNLKKTRGEKKIQVTLNNEAGQNMRNSLNGVFGSVDASLAKGVLKANGKG